MLRRFSRQVGAIFMLLSLSVALVPKELWHHHHEALVVCDESERHVEEKHVECAVCDHYLPVALTESLLSLNVHEACLSDLIAQPYISVELDRFSLPSLRAPPAIG